MPPRRRAAARRALITLALPGLLLVPAGSASAADSVTPNACHYAIDGYWRNLDLRFAGGAQPSAYAPPGAGFRLAGTAVAATLPEWISEYGFNLGHLNAGPNRIGAEVWVAVAGRGSAQGVQVLKANVNAETTITTDGSGEVYAGSTPLNVTVPLPDSVWTAPGRHGEQVTFEQAPPGTLPTIAGRNDRGPITPKGSVFIRAKLTNGTLFDVDCQPGRFIQAGDAFTAGRAQPFELAYADENAPPTGIAAPPVPSPPVTTAAAKLTAKRGRVVVKVANGGLIEASGQIRIVTAGKQRVGRRSRVVTAVPWTGYRVGARKSRTLTLKLGRDARALLAAKRSVKVKLSLRAASGQKGKYQKATTLTVSLRRG
ncbi:hypothetical protein [Patulibacter defluvii]|uniref:hypothetical protein n=1 Tax=Patulibacter defluvii TaxID=3095358 RepID=UPI002A74CEE2|nr:hypothetical protein [Patulibacter sp. DM4]